MAEQKNASRDFDRLNRRVEGLEDDARALSRSGNLLKLLVVILLAGSVATLNLTRGLQSKIVGVSGSSGAVAMTAQAAGEAVDAKIAAAIEAPAFQEKLALDAGAVPTGTILAFYGGSAQVPDGFVLCDGAIIKRTNHPRLYAHLVAADPKLKISEESAQLPDLRGEFLRGLDGERGVDPRRELGSYQGAEIGPHTHILRGYFRRGGSALEDPGNDPERNFTQEVELPVGQNSGEENRPRNVAVSFIIRG